MKKFAFLFIVISFNVFAQQFTVKQLTDFDFDIHNPTFIQSLGWFYSPDDTVEKLFFEVHKNDSSNIAGLKYDLQNDSFINLKYFTHDGFVNKNPRVVSNFDGYPIILAWETNRNGNFDIAYVIKDYNGDWSEVKFLTNTPEDETQMSLIQSCENYAIFKRENAIVVKSVTDIESAEDTVFLGDENISYSAPGGGCDVQLIVFAIKIVDGNKELVYRIKFGDSWSEVYDVPKYAGEPGNPVYYSFRNIAYETEHNGKSAIYQIHFDFDYWNLNYHDYLLADSSYSYSDFKTMTVDIPTSKKNYWEFPYIVRKSLNEKTFVETILFAQNGYGEVTDTTLPVGIDNPEPNVGTVGIDGYFHVNYSVWVDSANGRRNLFGIKQYGVYTSVDDNPVKPENFVLSQNYPNPFSAKGEPTTISYIIARSPDISGTRQSAGLLVQLKVYDALGCEVATLVNKAQSPGDYSVKFNAENLPSGIYFYTLHAGKFVQTKKMILMK